MYAVTKRNSGAPVRNIVQLAAGILSWSRCIFYSSLIFLLNVLDPRLAVLCYIDTGKRARTRSRRDLTRSNCSFFADSCMFWLVNEGGLRNNVLPSQLGTFDDWAPAVLQESARLGPGDLPTGLLKRECLFTAARFRAPKAYNLQLPSSDGVEVGSLKKFKGISHVSLKALPYENFRQSNRDRVITASWCLRPSRAGQVVMQKRSVALHTALNLKRGGEV